MAINWIDINDKCPPTRKRILILVKDGRGKLNVYSAIKAVHKSTYNDDTYSIYSVTKESYIPGDYVKAWALIEIPEKYR